MDAQTLYEGSNSYSLGTASNVYIADPGEYTYFTRTAEYAFLSSVNVGGVVDFKYTEIPAIPSTVAPPRISIPYTNSIGQTNYTGAKYIFTYEGGEYEVTVDSEEQGGNVYDPVTSVFARGWHLFTQIITSEGVGGGTTTEYAQYNSANYATVPAHVKIKLPGVAIANGGYIRESRNGHISGFTIQGSNDDSTWTDLYFGTTVGITTGVTFTFVNSVAYQYYRLRITSLTASSNKYFRLDEWNIHFSDGYIRPPQYPSLTYDGVTSLNITNAEANSHVSWVAYDSGKQLGCGVNETTYQLYKPGNYKALVAGANTYTITSNVTVTDTILPMYKYPTHGWDDE